jgi:hypothetical protein
LQALLAGVASLLSGPQAFVLRQLLTAWLMGCGGKMVHAARRMKGRHRTSLARFLNKSRWDATMVMTRLALRVLRGLKGCSRCNPRV